MSDVATIDPPPPAPAATAPAGALKGVEIAEAVDALRAVEDRISRRLAGLNESQGRFYRYREWLIRGPLLSRLFAAGLIPGTRTVPGLDMPKSVTARARRLARFAAAGADLRSSVTLNIRADALFLNTNLRSFYLGGGTPMTLKVDVRREEATGRSGPFGGSLMQEIAARRYAGRFVDIPPIIEFGDSGDLPFLLEPVNWGTRPCQATAANVCDALLPQLIEMYEDFGYTFIRPAEMLGDEAVVDPVAAAADCLGLDSETRSVMVASTRRLIESPRGVAISFVHHDLAPNNLLVQEDGTAVVLDWERAGEGPVGRDLYFLLREAPDRFAAVETASRRSQERFVPPDVICTLSEQLATVGALALADWREFERQCRLGNRRRSDVRRQLMHYTGLLLRGEDGLAKAVPPTRR